MARPASRLPRKYRRMTAYDARYDPQSMHLSDESRSTPARPASRGVSEQSSALSGQTSSIQQLFSQTQILADLERIEQRMVACVASHSTPISAAGSHIIQSGGKRLRAAIVLLAARLGCSDATRLLHAAAALELIHTASLVHDDLVDGAGSRRGQQTVHTRWDNDVALMLGDYFFALAAAEMALCHDTRVIMFYARAVQNIVEGELHPVTDVAPFEQALGQYLYKTGAKTATLFEAGCKAALALAGGTDEDIEAIGQYGYDLGLAFQIVDDMLDFTSDAAVLGKPAGHDLRQGTITLPLIYAVAESESRFLQEVIAAADLTDMQVERAIQEVRASGAISRTAAYAEQTIQRAIGHLARFADSAARQSLMELAQLVLHRNA